MDDGQKLHKPPRGRNLSASDKISFQIMPSPARIPPTKRSKQAVVCAAQGKSTRNNLACRSTTSSNNLQILKRRETLECSFRQGGYFVVTQISFCLLFRCRGCEKKKKKHHLLVTSCVLLQQRMMTLYANQPSKNDVRTLVKSLNLGPRTT